MDRALHRYCVARAKGVTGVGASSQAWGSTTLNGSRSRDRVSEELPYVRPEVVWTTMLQRHAFSDIGHGTNNSLGKYTRLSICTSKSLEPEV